MLACQDRHSQLLGQGKAFMFSNVVSYISQIARVLRKTLGTMQRAVTQLPGCRGKAHKSSELDLDFLKYWLKWPLKVLFYLSISYKEVRGSPCSECLSSFLFIKFI